MCTMDKLVAARLAAVLRAQADVVAYQQAVTIGVTDSFLKWQIDARRWQRPHPHVYVAHPGRLCDDQRSGALGRTATPTAWSGATVRLCCTD